MMQKVGGRYLIYFFMAMVCAAGVSCDDQGDNYLDGSVVKNYNVKFNDVRVRLYDSGLAVEYTSSSTDGEIALGIEISSSVAQLAKGKTYDLMQYGNVYRDGGFGTLPDLESGELTLDEYNGKNGSEVVGSFQAKFLAPSGSLQNLRGGFAATLEVVQ